MDMSNENGPEFEYTRVKSYVQQLAERLNSTLKQHHQYLETHFGPNRLNYVAERLKNIIDNSHHEQLPSSIMTNTGNWLYGNIIFVDVIMRMSAVSPMLLYLNISVNLFYTLLFFPGRDDFPPPSPPMKNNRFLSRTRLSEIAAELWCLTFAAINNREPSDVEYSQIFRLVDAVVLHVYPRGVITTRRRKDHGTNDAKEEDEEETSILDHTIDSIANTGFEPSVYGNEKIETIKYFLGKLLLLVIGNTKWSHLSSKLDPVLYNMVWHQIHIYSNADANADDANANAFLKDPVFRLSWSATHGPFVWTWLHTTAARAKNNKQTTFKFFAFLASFDAVIECVICRQHFNSNQRIRELKDFFVAPLFEADLPDPSVYCVHVHNEANNVHEEPRGLLNDYENWWSLAESEEQ